MPTIESQNEHAVTDSEKAKLFGEYPDTTDEQREITREARNIREMAHVRLNPRTITKLYANAEELTDIMKRLPKNKAPGQDKIDTILLRNLPRKSLVQLIYIINNIIKYQHYPDCLKKAEVVPIPKPGQEYIFPGQSDSPFYTYQQNQNQYINPSEIVPFQQSPFRPLDPSSSYYQSPDLQTSDIPVHLQHTLPQYRYTTRPPQIVNFQDDHRYNQFSFQNPNSGQRSTSGFRSPQDLKPTTIRPNYSHLFAKTHNRDPSQTETFLGQITLQNPVADAEQFEDFQSTNGFPEKPKDASSEGFREAMEDTSGNSIVSGSKPDYLNHRTRIVAPDPSKRTTKPQVNNYFVNTNGEVFSPTKQPTKPNLDSSPSSSLGQSLAFNFEKNKKSFIPKREKSGDLEPLLEEPLKYDFGTNNDDEVEIIKSPRGSHSSGDTGENIYGNGTKPTHDNYEYVEVNTQEPFDSTEYYSGESYGSHDSNRSDGSLENDIRSSDYHDEDGEELEDEEFDGEEELDGQEEQLEHLKETRPTSTTPKTLQSSSEEISTSFSVPSSAKNEHVANYEKLEDEPELVTSVVTSKTVVNNTVIASTTPRPTVTESVRVSTESSDTGHTENSTDTWVVIASVQTSRSVSGARYLPSSIVEQDVRVKLLNEHPHEHDEDDHEYNTENSREETTTEEETTTNASPKTKTSTESLIDKLDRAQSDLSSGFLTGGLGNNIAVIKENPEKIDMSTMEDIKLTTSTTKAPYPQVHIRKYSPSNRRTTTRRPRPSPKNKKPFNVNQPQGDQPINKSTDLTAILPPGYKLNASDDKSSKLLEEILNRVKPKKVEESKNEKTKELTTENVSAPSTDSNILTNMKVDNISKSLPPGYIEEGKTTESSILKNTKSDDISKFLPAGYKLPVSDKKAPEDSVFENIKVDNVSKFLPPGFESTSTEEKTTEGSISKNTKADDISKFLPPGYKLPVSDGKAPEDSVLKNIKVDDISKFLPPGYKSTNTQGKTTERSISKNTKADDISKFLPPGYKLPVNEDKTTEASIYKNTKADDISKFLPPGYKLPKIEEKTTESSSFLKNTKADDLSKFLPPGYKLPKSEKSTESSILKNTKSDDISKFLPPGYRVPKYKSTTESSLVKNTKADDVSKFLPPGYKLPSSSTLKPNEDDGLQGLKVHPVDLSAFLPPGFKPTPEFNTSTTENITVSDSGTTKKPASSSGGKIVYPSRPGGGVRKSATRTTPKSHREESFKNTPPTIHKGWPSRATTEFTGWPTPSTTPISIEKLLEAARAATSSTTRTIETTIPTSTTTTTTTTTTPRPTTPGVCTNECDLAATIKIIGGVKWAPELLDRNTKEWQVLANEVETQLDYVYSSSSLLNKWYKKIRIDGFSEGSVLVDYLVELNDLGRRIDTQQMKTLFHESLDDALLTLGGNREGKSLNESWKMEGKLALGNFIVDPEYTDFLVLPKSSYPTVGFAENDVLLPQWAIAVIVIGLASLLFVIIFGVTVLVNRQKNSKKKNPTPLTEDMLNELNKNHMGGIDNYGADDLYNMEDAWNEREYEQKPSKKRSNGSIHDNSMSNLYDSWRSEWNGYYYNAYYGNNPGSSHSGYNGRRRSDYDTNF